MKIINYFLFFICASGFSQTVVVDDVTKSPSELVNILMNDACVEVSNAGISSSQSVAYFNDQGGDFPISEGIIIRSGKAKFSEGSYTGTNLNSQVNTNTDPYLEQINIDSGQSPIITDVAYLEFEFTPLSDKFEFEFLFASNEYGQWQCVSSDIFAFLLTDLVTGETVNLAHVPGTTKPISVKNIKDSAFNPTCGSDNPDLFSTYNVNKPSGSVINMNGYTVVMKATSAVQPGNPYKIRLVIGDSNDGKYDSAIFLAGGSFHTNFDLGKDRMICDGDVQTLQTGLDPAIYQHEWTFNGTVIADENGNTLQVAKIGTYGVSITSNATNCLITDKIVFTELMVESPKDLSVCYNTAGSYVYDLTSNNENTLGISDATYDLRYYGSEADVAAENPIPKNDLRNYASTGNQRIYIKTFTTATGHSCGSVHSFDLLVNDPILVNRQPLPLEVCGSSDSPIVDLTEIIPEILMEQNPSLYNFSFFESQTGAQQNTGPINTPDSYTVQTTTSPIIIWARVENANLPECFTTTSFEILVNPLPLVDTLSNELMIKCSSFVLPNITNGQYWTGPNGTGKQLFPGDIIKKNGTYYIFSGPNENGCTNQSSFRVYFVSSFGVRDTYCGRFKVPNPLVGKFYTKAGGDGGLGEEIPAGTILDDSQTVYYYAKINGILCRDSPIKINILPLPLVDDSEDVVTCNQYVLPPLENGNYFTQSHGKGQQLNAGDTITSSQDIYIFSDKGPCTNQNKFNIRITPNFNNIKACGSYTLPSLKVGGYYTQASGMGEQIPEGTSITSTRTIYFYAETTSTPNCTKNTSFIITVNPIPDVDQLQDVLLCHGSSYTLPTITKGQYFTKPDRKGKQLHPGEIITSSQTVYINNILNGCANETDFFVEIRPLPSVDNFTDIYACQAYVLPELEHGKYFTQSGGTGTELHAGEKISSTKTIYIYNEYDDLTSCSNEDAFTVYFNGIDVGDFEDVYRCNEYILPPLEIGNYFTKINGKRMPLFAGDTIIKSQRIYVYGLKGERFVCTDEASFFVEITQTPVMANYQDVESCGNYILPELPQSEYDMSYYRSPSGIDKITASEYNFTKPGVHTIYVRATSKINSNCFQETQFQLTIHPLLELTIDGGTLCWNLKTGEVASPVLLTSGLDPNEFEVNWYLNNSLVHTGQNYTAMKPGTYTVKTVKLMPEIGAKCNYKPTTVTVLESAKPSISAEVSQPFLDVAMVTVQVVDGIGEYEYQLDNGGYQSNNEFHDVSAGSHIISVKGVHGSCSEAVLQVNVVKFPKFFTPNNDGKNDTWNIFDLKNHPEAVITVFDRYGKFLATFGSQDKGWNGLYKGEQLPSSDYWFVVKFEQDGDKKIFRAHFALKAGNL